MDYSGILVTELRKMVEQRGLANTLPKRVYQMRKHELVQALKDTDTAAEAERQNKDKKQTEDNVSSESMLSGQRCDWDLAD